MSPPASPVGVGFAQPTSGSAPAEPIFRSLFQAGDRAQPVSPAVHELWGNSSSLTSVAPATSVARPRRRRPRRRPAAPAHRSRSICSATAAARSAASPHSQAAFSQYRRRDRRLPRTLNKTSIKPAVYGERFVKRHGLFCMTVASRHGVVSSCVSRQDHDRSAVHQLDKDRSGRRAGRGHAISGAGLADFRSDRRRSRRRRRRAADAARRCVAAGAPGHGRSVRAQQPRRRPRSCRRCRSTSPRSRCRCSNIHRF